MPDRKAQVQIEFTEKGIKDVQDKIKQTTSVTDKLGKVLSVDLARAAMEVGQKLLEIGRAIAELITKADAFNKMKSAFATMAQSMGTDSEKMLAKLRTATKGMVSDFDLVQQANKAMLTGMKPDEIVNVFNMARVAAANTGQEFVKTQEAMTAAMATGNTEALKSMGITVTKETAEIAYAKSIHTTAENLTENAKKHAAQTVAMQEGMRMVKEFDQSTEVAGIHLRTFTEIQKEGEASWENFKIGVGQGMAKAVTTLDAAFQKISGSGTAFKEFIKTMGSIMLNVATLGLGGRVKDLFEGLADTRNQQTILSGVLKIIGIFKILPSAVTDIFKAVGERIQALGPAIQDGFEALTTPGASAITAFTTTFNKQLTGSMKDLYENLKKEAHDVAAQADKDAKAIVDKINSTDKAKPGGAAPSAGSPVKETDWQKVKNDAFNIGMQYAQALGDGYMQGLQARAAALQRRTEELTLFSDVIFAKLQQQMQEEIDATQAYYDKLLEIQKQYNDAKLAEVDRVHDEEKGRDTEQFNAGLISRDEYDRRVTDVENRRKLAEEAAKKDADKKLVDLEKQKADKLATMEAEKAAKEKELGKQKALLSYMGSVAALNMQKQLQIAQVEISTAMGIASAWGASMQYGIAAPFVAAPLTALMLATGLRSIAIIKAQQVLPPAELFMAEGGIVTGPTRAVIGEAGPEAVIPLDKAGPAGFGNVVININGPVFPDKDTARRLAQMVDRELYEMKITGQSVALA